MNKLSHSWTPKDIVYFDVELQSLQNLINSIRSMQEEYSYKWIVLLSVYYLIICARHICQNVFLPIDNFIKHINPFITNATNKFLFKISQVTPITKLDQDDFPKNNNFHPHLMFTISEQFYDIPTARSFFKILSEQIRSALAQTSDNEASTKLALSQLTHIFAAIVILLESIDDNILTPEKKLDLKIHSIWLLVLQDSNLLNPLIVPTSADLPSALFFEI